MFWLPADVSTVTAASSVAAPVTWKLPADAVTLPPIAAAPV